MPRNKRGRGARRKARTYRIFLRTPHVASPITTDGQLREREHSATTWHTRPAPDNYRQVACATPASRTGMDLREQKLYVWRGKANPLAREIWQRIHTEIPPESHFNKLERPSRAGSS